MNGEKSVLLCNRTGCCAGWPKPCSYHEGYQDALDMFDLVLDLDDNSWGESQIGAPVYVYNRREL